MGDSGPPLSEVMKMVKYQVTSSVLFVAGKKYVRGDIIDCATPELHGTRLQPVVVEEPKEKPVRKPRAKKAE